MNTRAGLIAVVVAGLLMGLLSGLPILQFGNCLLGLWMWGSGLFCVWLFMRSAEPGAVLKLKHGFALGGLSGLVGVLVTIPIMVTLTLGLPQWARLFGGKEPDLSLVLILSTFGIILFPLVGGVGGLLGAKLFGGKPATAQAGKGREPQAVESPHLRGELFRHLEANPRDTALFESLADFYLAATPEQREAVRAFVRENRDLMNALEKWVPDMREDNPERYVPLRLTSVSMRDGYPDYRDTLLALTALWEFAEERSIDPAPLYRAAARISGDVDIHNAKGLISQVMRPSRREQLSRGFHIS